MCALGEYALLMFYMIYILQSGLFFCPCILGCNKVLICSGVFLCIFVLQAIVHLAGSLLPSLLLQRLSPVLRIKVCLFAFDLHSSRETHLT